MSQPVNRRTFLTHTAAVGAGITILKSGVLKAGVSPVEEPPMAGPRGPGTGGSIPFAGPPGSP